MSLYEGVLIAAPAESANTANVNRCTLPVERE